MQTYGSPASRNPISASGVEPGKVPTPSTPVKTPSDQATGTGHAPGSAVTGFAGGLKPGKV